MSTRQRDTRLTLRDKEYVGKSIPEARYRMEELILRATQR